jgi:diguanylate cyclase (GGDEF)-like protein/PAS domain S-box-containing protein
VGMISLLPLTMVFSRAHCQRLLTYPRRYEFVGIAAGSLLATYFALRWASYPFILIAVPLLLASLRLGLLGTATINLANLILVLVLMLKGNLILLNDATLMQSHVLIATALALLGPLMTALLIEQHDRTISRLRQGERTFRDAMNYAPIGMVLVGIDGVCLRANPAVCEILGYTETELVGMSMREVCPDEDVAENTRRTVEMLSGKVTHFSMERRYIHKSGAIIWARMSMAAARDAQGNPLHLITQIENIDDHKQNELQRDELQRELEHRARHDGLTGLLNRQTFEQVIDQLLQSDDVEIRQHSLCYIDLDRFKVLNDSVGHAAGDVLLRQISQRLTQYIRSHDTLARFGGDEFGLLLPDCPTTAARRVGEAIIDAINSVRFNWEGRAFDIGASIGIVPFSADCVLTVGELMSRADVACYTAKNEGRNRVAIYDGGDSIAARDHHQIQIAASIREALEAGRFCLYAQRIEPLDANQSERPIELLVRLRTQQGQLLPPGAFIPAAERYDLMADIDRWVVSTALLEFGPRLAAIDNIHISINLSGTSFNDPDFSEFLRVLIRNTPINPQALCFELTETAVINDMAHAAALLQMLQQEGCKVALDDFGNGLSSFSYLKSFPAQIIKIDGSFVRTICESEIDRAIVESINQIAHRLGAKTVAEYVETLEIAEILREIGVDYAQGYAFSKPEPLEGMIQLLTQSAPSKRDPALKLTGAR